MAKKKKKLVLIDSNALVHRAFHALPPLTKKDGTPTGAVYGFALTLLSMMEELKPDYLVATFDLSGPTFRHKQFKEYKATRAKAPDELYAQIPLVKQLLVAFGISIFEKKGFEADDVIGTLTKDPQLEKKVDTVIVTGDLDTLQLVDEDTSVYTLRRGIKDTVVYNAQAVMDRYGIEPEQIIDFKALRGDASDNIPGIKGVGEKTATKLLQEFKSLDKIYENLSKVQPESLQNKLREGEKDARLSYELARIVTDVPLEFNLDSAKTSNLSKEKLARFFKQMEFYSLYKRMGGEDVEKNDIKEAGDARQIETAILEKPTDLEKLRKQIGKNKIFSFFVLSDGEKYFESRPEGIGISTDGEKAYFIPVQSMGRLLDDLENASIVKAGFNVKFGLELLWKHWMGGEDNEALVKKLYGNEIGKYGGFYDVQLAAYLLGSNGAGDLEKLIFEEFGGELACATTKSGQSNLLSDNSENEKKCAAEKAGWIFRLLGEYKKRLNQVSKQQKSMNNKKTLTELFDQCEMPVAKILAKMEIAGVLVESETLNKVSRTAEKEIGILEKKIHALAKEKFNINSPSQLAVILYDKLFIPTTEIRRGKTGFSTDADQLRKVRDLHPIIPLVEKYRELFKVKTTYADALPLLVQKDGRIHADFNQAVAATGRLSSSDPNMQNIPKRGKLADLIRTAFVASSGNVLVSADYSQIDLRVAAHLSGDPKMIEAFENGQDIHRATAGWVNGIVPEEVSTKQRNEAKSLNFGILYGMGQYGFMRDSGVSGQRAKQFIDQYKKTFAQLTRFIEQTKEFARQNGFVETQLGRRRYIGSIQASNAQARAAAERMAVNLPIQGLAADIMKLAMVETEKLLHQYNKKEIKVKLILQIHDELIFEVERKSTKQFMADVKKVMEGVYKLRVPLTVDVSSGRNWKEL